MSFPPQWTGFSGGGKLFVLASPESTVPRCCPVKKNQLNRKWHRPYSATDHMPNYRSRAMYWRSTACPAGPTKLKQHTAHSKPTCTASRSSSMSETQRWKRMRTFSPVFLPALDKRTAQQEGDINKTKQNRQQSVSMQCGGSAGLEIKTRDIYNACHCFVSPLHIW